MRPCLPAGLYGMADAAFGDPLVLGCALAAGGCRVVQLRAKSWDAGRRLDAAHALVGALFPRGVLVIINDDIDAAARAGASGVHLGQDDGPIAAARARLGPDALLGCSTHNLDQVACAAAEGADYIGFGPVWPTETKTDAGPERGCALLSRAVAASPLPVVAIGGITRARLAAVRATGTAGWAVGSDLLRHAALGPEALSRAARTFA